jgi:V8-like Glu-specific endopeptidase
VGTFALVGVASLIFALGVWSIARDLQHRGEVNQLAADLAASDAQLTELAKNTIPESAKDNLRKAVYLVAQGFGDKLVGKATAWALGPNMLATNAHVTSKMSKLDDWKLIGPNGEVIPIEKVVSHPGYDAFKKYRDTVGSVTGGEFATLDVVNQYDVGIIYTAEPLPPDPETKQIVTLEPASADYVKSLEPGAAVAAIGFPIEDMTGQMVVTQAPATLHFGNISSLTDVFMCKADPGHQLLIQHSVPVAGGMSGSPLIDSSGKVIGVVSGGTTATVIEDVAVRLKAPTSSTSSGQGKDQPTAKVEQDTIRIPNAALVNFAQRIDLLSGIGDGTSELSDEKAYWKDAAKKFENFFENAAHNLVELAGERYDVKGGNARQSVGTGTLEPGTSSFDADFHHWVLKPGHVYGFIADSESGAPIALSVTKSGSSQTLKDKADPRPAPVLEIAPTAWVTVEEETPFDIKVFSSVDKPADYKLYVYDWEKPVGTSATEASAPARQ